MSDIYVEDTRTLEEIAEDLNYKLTKRLMVEYLRKVYIIMNAQIKFETGTLAFKRGFLPPTESTFMHSSYAELHKMVERVNHNYLGYDFEFFLETHEHDKEENIHPMCVICMKKHTRNGECPNKCKNHTEYCEQFKGITL